MSTFGPPPSSAHVVDDIAGAVAAREAELIAFRRDLHANPELGGHERRTTERVVARLRAEGLTPTALQSGTGLICDIVNGEGPLVALRADLDALPLVDVKDVPYCSINPGACHACGHDVHTSVVLGAGLALRHADGVPPGTIRLIFQPSEEVQPGGSHHVIGEGHLQGVAAVFALHCDPNLLAGQVGLRVGAITSAADFMTIEISAGGGHTARPHLTTDPVYAAARVITDLPGSLSRLVDPRMPLSVIFGQVHAGTAANLMARSATLAATIRTMDRDTWGAAPDVIRGVVAKTLESLGMEYQLHYGRGNPPVVNDAAATAMLATAVHEQLGAGGEAATPQSMGAEDFAWYLEHVPGSMGRLGVGVTGGTAQLHNPDFDVDERAIGVGARVLAQAAVVALAAG